MKMHLSSFLLAAALLAIAHAAAIIPVDLVAQESQNSDQIAEVTEERSSELVRPKRGLLLAKAALIGGGILGAKAIGAGLIGAGLYKATALGALAAGYGYGHGYGGSVTYHHYVQPYYAPRWHYGPSYYGGGYYSSW